MLDIEIKTIPHKAQRYETAGDWYEEEGKTVIRVSDCKDKRMEWLLAIHELVERCLCDVNGVPESSVDKFDFDSILDDPGDDSRAPYHAEHCYATGIERILCAAMGIAWEEYDGVISNL